MKPRHPVRLFAWFAAAAACGSALAQQPPGWQFDRGVNRDALPTVPAGFEVSFFAREPLVRQPCSTAFDAKGRLCVGMGPQYRNPKPNTPGDAWCSCSTRMAMAKRIEHVRFTEPPVVRHGRLTFDTECRLRTADGQSLCSLTNRFTLAAQTNAWLLTWDAAFHSEDGDFTFGDQEEMGFGARVATGPTEKNGGVITSSAGLKTAKDTWGQSAEWCDYSGTVEGMPIGITLLSDPKNFRPSWWHNRASHRRRTARCDAHRDG